MRSARTYYRAAGFALYLFVSVAAGQAQPAPAPPANSTTQLPKYEVASIRENTNPNPRWSMSFTQDGVRAMDVTLLWVLHEAYGITDDELWSGGPTWIKEKRFDIEAKYDTDRYPNPTREERQEMLQQLLADRFKLVVHREPKEFPLYALVVAKGGPKFEETKLENLRQNPTYGVICTHQRGGKGVMEMSGCTLAQFAFDLGGNARNDLGRRVADQTGLNGHYTIALHWAPLSMANPAEQSANATDPTGPSIFTAVKEQLGLELKPMTGPLDTMVIDHAELPNEN